MSKRAVLWMVGLVVFGFTYVAAVNVKEVAGGLYGLTYLTCKNMWNPFAWFSRGCSDSLPPRLGALALGVVVLLICGYFAEKGAPRPLAVSRPSNYLPPSRAVHNVTLDPASGVLVYQCLAPGCDFRGITKSAAIAHGRLVAPPASRQMAIGTEDPAETSQLPPMTPIAAPTWASTDTPPQFKTCPDCAEQVRYAARKCRFCGFQLEDASVADRS